MDEIAFLKLENELKIRKIYAILKDINKRLDIIENDIEEINTKVTIK